MLNGFVVLPHAFCRRIYGMSHMNGEREDVRKDEEIRTDALSTITKEAINK